MKTKTLPKKYANKVVDKFPNFSSTGSIKGMKDKYYGKDALLVRCCGYIYNAYAEPSMYYNLAH